MKLTKKMIIAGAGVVGAVGIGSAAFAFFNTGGSGSGAAIINATVQGVTLTGTSSAALVPNVSQPVNILATNPNSASARIGKVSITNAKVVGTEDQEDRCLIGVFGEDPAAEHTLAPNGTLPLNNIFSISLAEQPVDQTDCLGLTITYTIAVAAPPALP